MRHGGEGGFRCVRWLAAALLLAAAWIDGGTAAADVAPPPPEPDREDRQPGVISFLVGEWSPDCSAPERAVFDEESVSTPEETGQPPVRRSVARSIRHGDFGVIHALADDKSHKAYVVVFQVVDENAIRIIEQVEDGRPLGMVDHEVVLRRCR
jgi:hypothetical protein